MEAISAFFTDPLRLTLGAAAVVVLVGIFVFGRSKGNNVPAEELSKEAISEALTRNDDDNVIVKDKPIVVGSTSAAKIETPQTETTIVATDDNPQEEVLDIQHELEDDESSEKDMFVVLHVVAPEGMAFTGNSINQAIKECNLVYGDYKIFHYPHPQDESLSLFSVANMLKPGFFEADKLENLTTNGISFFMRIPVMEGHHQDVFTTMLATAQAMSRRLGGSLLDEQHQALTQSTVDTIKEQIKHFENLLDNRTKTSS